MVQLGKVGNLMVDVKASNVKLRDRAARIVEEVTGAGEPAVRAALEKAGWDLRKACAALEGGAG